MNTRRRMKIRTIRAIIKGLPRKPRAIILPLRQKIEVTIEIPHLADSDSSTVEEFEKNFKPITKPITEPASQERGTMYINGKPVQWIG